MFQMYGFFVLFFNLTLLHQQYPLYLYFFVFVCVPVFVLMICTGVDGRLRLH